MWSPVRLRAFGSLVFALSLASPAYGETVAPNPPEEGLTRDTFTDPSTPPKAPAPSSSPRRTHTKRTQLDSKDFLSVHHARRHHGAARNRTRVAAAAPRPPRRRNPVVGFVYWWNGWVMRTFHTKIGTVMLGTIGAKS